MASPAVRDQDNHNDAENSSMGYCGKVMNKVVEFPRKLKKLGQDDPRRIVHSLKVGLAVLLVSLLYYFQPFYSGLGDTAMWAILTVVVVFEFSVGTFYVSVKFLMCLPKSHCEKFRSGSNFHS